MPVPGVSILPKSTSNDNSIVSSTNVMGMAMSPDLIKIIATDCKDVGVVGDEEFALAIYLIGTSRLMEKPLGAIVHGKSGIGKSYILSIVSKLFPLDQCKVITSMSPKALFYGGSLEHRVIILGDRSHNARWDAGEALRQLFSDGSISRDIPIREDGKFITQTFTANGPIAYIETTTMDPKDIFIEDLSRVLILSPDDSPEQTAAIVKYLGDREQEDWKYPNTQAIIARHHEFQGLLRPLPVRIPFVRDILTAMPMESVQMRRVASQIISTVSAVTLLTQHQRQLDSKGNLVATVADYEVARRILTKPLSRTIGVTERSAVLYHLLYAKYGTVSSFTITDVSNVAFNDSRSSINNWILILRHAGSLIKVKATKGPTPAVYKLTARNPESSILPVISSLSNSTKQSI